MTAAAMLLLTTTSCRRDLWVYQDNFKQVELDIDWRNYFRDQQLYPNTPDPDGMTVWFFPKDGRTSFQYTTAEVRHYETYLSQGDYDALVIDYSPEEYGHQEFIGMDYAATAKVQATPSSYQPESNDDLYGSKAYAYALPNVLPNGLYQLAWEPEDIASDTCHMTVNTGRYDRYIPYKERDSYQSTLVKQLYKMEPLIVPWQMRVRIYLKGIYYLNSVTATIAGLADGYKLVDCVSSDTPCLMKIDGWELHVAPNSADYETEGGLGYIAKTFKTWGPMNFTNRDYEVTQKQREKDLNDRPADQVRINLNFLLRDRSTQVNCHFDVGNLIQCYYNEYALRIDLLEGFAGMPSLPYVEAVNGMGFDGVVVPWEEKQDADVTF